MIQIEKTKINIISNTFIMDKEKIFKKILNEFSLYFINRSRKY